MKSMYLPYVGVGLQGWTVNGVTIRWCPDKQLWKITWDDSQ